MLKHLSPSSPRVFKKIDVRSSGRTIQAFRSLTVHVEQPEPAPPRLFDYQTIVTHLKPCKEIVAAVEDAFGKLSKNEVDVPTPMHIGIPERGEVGPGDCHIKAGYIEGSPTWTVKLANVSFYHNIERSLSPGSGIFIVCSAVHGRPLGIFQENRYLTDLRTGAAGAVAVKHLVERSQHRVAFIGTGAIATAMAEATHCVHQFEYGFAYGTDRVRCQIFANEIHDKLGYKVLVCDSAEEAVRNADVVFTQTTGSEVVLQPQWLKPRATVIASGSDQATKNELPVGLMRHAKFVTDLTRQCAKVGELRTALADGMKETQVYAELGEIVNGTKKGREENDMQIVVDLTGTGAQDAAVGQVAWDVLSKLPVA